MTKLHITQEEKRGPHRIGSSQQTNNKLAHIYDTSHFPYTTLLLRETEYEPENLAHGNFPSDLCENDKLNNCEKLSIGIP
jgi:hypothetical protein